MERASKSGFKMKSSALRAGETIMGRFMAMGKTLGNSKTKTSTTIDPSKYYTAPKKKVEKPEEKPISAVDKLKEIKAEDALALREMNINSLPEDKKLKRSEIKSLNKYKKK